MLILVSMQKFGLQQYHRHLANWLKECDIDKYVIVKSIVKYIKGLKAFQFNLYSYYLLCSRSNWDLRDKIACLQVANSLTPCSSFIFNSFKWSPPFWRRAALLILTPDFDVSEINRFPSRITKNPYQSEFNYSFILSKIICSVFVEFSCKIHCKNDARNFGKENRF